MNICQKKILLRLIDRPLLTTYYNYWVKNVDFCGRWILQQSHSKIQCCRTHFASHTSATRIFVATSSTRFNFARAFGLDLHRRQRKYARRMSEVRL